MRPRELVPRALLFLAGELLAQSLDERKLVPPKERALRGYLLIGGHQLRYFILVAKKRSFSHAHKVGSARLFPMRKMAALHL